MSGHSKWTQIKHQKGVTDAQKSKIYGKYSRLISSELRRLGGDKNHPTIRAVVERAKSDNVPNEVIDRAIAKANDAKELQSCLFEGYGPGGVGILIECLTDNTNRISAEIRHIFSKHNGNMGTPGSVQWAFEKNSDGMWQPTTTVEISDSNMEQLVKLLEVLDDNDDTQNVVTNLNEDEHLGHN